MVSSKGHDPDPHAHDVPTSHSRSTSLCRSSSDSSEPLPDFTAVRSGGSRPLSRCASAAGSRLSRYPSASASLAATRSNNGYGVSPLDPEVGSIDGEVGEAQGGEATPSEKDAFEVTWDGGDADPGNPRSWSRWRKWTIVMVVANVALCVTAASSIYASTVLIMQDVFHTSRTVSTLGLSAFVLGIAFGPMFLGPLSEFFGRRPIFLVSWFAFIIWTIPSAVAKNIATVVVSRFFTGFSGSAFMAVSGGTMSDLFAGSELQAPMMAFTMAPFIGPALGPIIGGFVNYNVDWRWTYYVLIMWAFVLEVALVFIVPETYHPVLLRNRARKKRATTGDERWLAASERTQRSIVKIIAYSLLRPFQLLFFEPMCLNLCILSAILLGVLYLFFGAFNLIFSDNYGFNLWQDSLTFLGILGGMVAAACTDPLWHRIRNRLIAKNEAATGIEGASEPEFRLPPAILGSILVPIGIFWFGWTSYPSIHWIVPIIGSSLFGGGTVLVFTGIFTFLVDAYPRYAASALAANAFVRCSFAAVFPLFGLQMYEKLGYQWASSLLAFLALAMMPFPFIFFRYGKRIRNKSKYATL